MRKIIPVVGMALGLLLALIVAAELSLGTWFSKDPLDRVGLARDTAVEVSAASLYDGGTDFDYGRDHWGFRGPGVDPAQVTILTVGGSTTNQPYLPDDLTWQAVMARELAERGHAVAVANAGMDGHGTKGHLRAMAEWFPRVPGLKPRFILFYVGLDELQAARSAGLPPLSRAEWVRQRSALWQAATKALARLDARRPQPVHRRVDYAAARWTDTPAQPDWRPEGDNSLSAYQDRLRALARAAHAMGGVPVFVTQTRGDYKLADGKVLGMVEDGGLTGVDHYRRLSAVNDATRAVCADDGLLCLDLAREVTFEAGDFYDYLHNTPQGAAKIGRWMAGKLAGLV